jgi:outer membrane receptor for ferrienterochelin and colicins
MTGLLKKAALLAALCCACSFSYSQKLMGLVVQKNPGGVDEPLPGANVYWEGTSVATTTGNNGVFQIDRSSVSDRLVVSFVGFVSDTVHIADQTNLKIELRPERILQEVVVEGWKPATGIDHARGINTVIMSEKELFKAACCNLSESFETNPSVDVAFTDAITGTRQIQMLGLAGPNTVISIENMPAVRGLASSQGIQLIPGTWINSIEVTKGAGSVVNGFESIAGQINVEMKKPQESEKLYLNGYVNNSGRSEANVNYSGVTGKKWATAILLHGSVRPFEMDQNKDSFLDFPTGSQLNAVNRWVFNSGNGWLSQFGVKVLKDIKRGGQKTSEANAGQAGWPDGYRLKIETDRYEMWGKLGYQFPSRPYKSIGLQLSIVQHDHDSYYGFNSHSGREKSGYANLIYQSIIGTTQHKFKTGLSYLYDAFDERLANSERPIRVIGEEDRLISEIDFVRTERVPGAFVEYTYDYIQKVKIIAGFRVDYHNLFGLIYTPRIHTLFNPGKTTSIRLSAGKGTRVNNVLIENTGVLASSRQIVFRNLQSSEAYGFKPDVAWNYGLNISQEFTANYRPGTITVDYYITDFRNQVITDLDQSTWEVNFAGLKGKSYSRSLQVQADYQPLRRFDVRIAYRLLDVKTRYLAAMLERPLIPKHRAFVNLAFETKNKWKFDYTFQWMGKQRIPGTIDNPERYQLAAYSKPYTLMNAQISKDWKDRWSMYVGVENAGNFRLKNPIVAADDPFGDYFDSSMVWGPVFGRMAYAGFRYRIK